MAITVAKLAATLGLNSTGFTQGLASARVSMGTFQSIALGAFAKIGSSLVGMVDRGIHALPHLIESGLELGHALEISGKMTGIAATTMATYHRAARLAGLGVEEFDTSIARLNAHIGEAIHGDKKLSDILGRVGFNMAKIADATPEETFLGLADAIQKTQSAYERSYIAKAAFGRGGLRMLPLLSGGRAGFSGLAASTRALGAAPTESEIVGISKASIALKDLATITDGLSLQLATQFGPTIEIIARRGRELAEATHAPSAMAAIVAAPFRGPMKAIAMLDAILTPGSSQMVGPPYDARPLTRRQQRQVDASDRRSASREAAEARRKVLFPRQYEPLANFDPIGLYQRAELGPVSWHRQSAYSRRIRGRSEADWEAIRSDRNHVPGLMEAFGARGDGQYRDRLGRTLHDVVNQDRVSGPSSMPIGWNYQGFPNEMIKKGNILGELKVIGMEGNYSNEQLAASRAMLEALKSIDRKTGGMGD